MYILDGSTCGLFSFEGIVGFLYVSVCARMYTIRCVFKKISIIWHKALVPIIVKDSKYGDGIRIIFCYLI